MRKAIFLALLSIASVSTVASAQSQLATLSHEGNISSFYGVNALKDAHAAAVNGDVITLSSGSFNAVDITKNITVRGAGMEYDKDAFIQPTYLIGKFSINTENVIDEQYDKVILESLAVKEDVNLAEHDKAKIRAIKCKFCEFRYSRGCSKSEIEFLNCRITSSLNSYGSVVCRNSLILGLSTSHSPNILLDNCIFSLNNSTITNATINNCIIFNPTNIAIRSNIVVFNCVSWSDNTFRNFGLVGNNICLNDEQIFKESITELKSDVIETSTFELTDDAAGKYLGVDGTQVGIYGGTLPFNPIPNNPRITKFQVSSRTTADGKLSVDLSVSAVD